MLFFGLLFNRLTLSVLGRALILLTHVFGIPLEVPDSPREQPTTLQLETLDRTVRLIPSSHRAHLSLIQVRRPNQVPATGGGHNHQQRLIRLSHASLSRRFNRNFNQTLLHEMGHLIERAYGIARWMRRQSDNPDARELLETAHDGHTGGPAERIADCYMIYLIRFFGGAANLPADPAAYRGDAAERRFRALLQSPAFANSADTTAEMLA